LGAEKLQLQTAARLFAAVALLSVVALALVDLHEKSRLEPGLPSEVEGIEVKEGMGISPPALAPARHRAGGLPGPSCARWTPRAKGGQAIRQVQALARLPELAPARGRCQLAAQLLDD